MKKVIIGLFSAFILLYIYDQPGQGMEKEDKLIFVVKSLEKLNASINEWSIYYRFEDRYIDSEENFRELEWKLKNKYSDYLWVKDIDNDHHVTLTGKHTRNESREQVSLTIFKDGARYKVLQTYSFTAESWSTERYLNIVQGLEDPKNLYFTVKADVNKDKLLKLSDQAKRILGELSAEPVESLVKDDFVSISAFNDNWANHIPTKDNGKINLQLGMRKDVIDSLINITIGSPIIIVEY
ncbi:YwmB family TATA-box binding protein [Cytobacillus gottheilii]|uniref:YwmB family TATA-box binding protein n=1 Tax=Cytobacillus gottheilii TaxID=859144 RepID=UPI00249587BC|nr:YwmB family TATA-box binding protein [Cytobacillus gottheilii]